MLPKRSLRPQPKGRRGRGDSAGEDGGAHSPSPPAEGARAGPEGGQGPPPPGQPGGAGGGGRGGPTAHPPERRGRGLTGKAAKARRYQVSPAGRTAIAAVLAARQADIAKLAGAA